MKNRTDFFKVNFLYFVCTILLATINILAVCIKTDFPAKSAVFSVVVQIVIMVAVPFALFSLLFNSKPKNTFSELRFKPLSVKNVFICLGLGVCIFIINLFLANLFSVILSLFGYRGPSGSAGNGFSVLELLSTIVLSCVLPAFCEEFLHRGVLFSIFNKQVGVKKAIVLSGFLFGLMHFNIAQFGYAFILGMIFAYATFLSGSIIPAMIMHFLNNFLSTYISFSSVNSLPVGKFFAMASQSNFFIFRVIILLVALFVFRLLLKLLIKDIHDKKFLEAKKLYVNEYLRTEILQGGDIAQKLAERVKFGFTCFEEVEIDGEKRVITVKIPLSAVGIATALPRKASFEENIFLYGSLIVGVLMTFYSLIWAIV